jgi:hypothetical protein
MVGLYRLRPTAFRTVTLVHWPIASSRIGPNMDQFPRTTANLAEWYIAMWFIHVGYWLDINTGKVFGWDLLNNSRPRWCNCYRACHRTQGSRVQTWPKAMNNIIIRRMTSFGGVVKPSAPCRKSLWHVKVSLTYDRDTDRQNSAAISRPVSPRCAARCLL